MIRFSHDTRSMQPGDYYVAIHGERYDGHDFIPQALAQGAAGLVIERDLPADLVVPHHVEVRRVANSVEYLAQLAKQRIESYGTQVIAVTGSVGKTTTKRALVSVLSRYFPVVTPRNNLNTLLGIALTVVNELTSPDQKLVVEIGMYYRGIIARVCEFIPPLIGVVTSVQPVHLETMGTIENIALAKGELVEALPPHGIACLNADDPRVRAMQDRCKGRVLFYGAHPESDVHPAHITVRLPLLGSYQIYTAMAVIAVGRCLGLSDEQINQGLAELTPEKGRLVPLPGVNGVRLIDDTYNASLTSTLAALEVLSQHETRRIAFLGDMLELGSEEQASHRAVLTYALEVADQLVLVGPRLALAWQQLAPTPRQPVALFATSQEVVAALADATLYQPTPGDVVLVKGSAGMRMERVVQALLSPELDSHMVLVRQEASWQNL